MDQLPLACSEIEGEAAAPAWEATWSFALTESREAVTRPPVAPLLFPVRPVVSSHVLPAADENITNAVFVIPGSALAEDTEDALPSLTLEASEAEEEQQASESDLAPLPPTPPAAPTPPQDPLPPQPAQYLVAAPAPESARLTPSSETPTLAALPNPQPTIPFSLGDPRTPPPSPKAPPSLPADKGELLWSADLQIATPRNPEINLPSEGAAGGEVVHTPSPPASFSSAPPARPGAGNQDAPPDSHRQDQAGQDAQPREQHRPPQPVQPTLLTPEPVLATPHASPQAHPEISHSLPPPEQASREQTAPVGEIPARPLPPRQIASVHVRLDEPGSNQPSMRLVVSQRGENIDVRLRSVAESIARPVSASMEPLLESLARQGIVERTASHARNVEPIAAATESVRGTWSLSESSAAANHESPQEQHDSRDPQQQERHGQNSRQNRRRPQQAFSFQPFSTPES